MLCPGKKRDRSHPLILRARRSAAESPSLCSQAWFPADPPANVDVDVPWFTSSTGSNVSLPAGGVNPLEPCGLWSKLNAKGQRLPFIRLQGYLWDTQWSYFTPSHRVIIFHTRLLLRVTCPASLPGLHMPCKGDMHSVPCSPFLTQPPAVRWTHQVDGLNYPYIFGCHLIGEEGPMWRTPQEKEAKARGNAKDSGMTGEICPWKIGIQMFCT